MLRGLGLSCALKPSELPGFHPLEMMSSVFQGLETGSAKSKSSDLDLGADLVPQVKERACSMKLVVESTK